MAISAIGQNIDKKAKEFEDYIWLGGHRYQERGGAFGNYYETLDAQPMGYNPLHRQLVLDMIELCEKLLSGEIVGEETAPFNGRPAASPTCSAVWRSAGMIYLQSQVK